MTFYMFNGRPQTEKTARMARRDWASQRRKARKTAKTSRQKNRGK